MSKRATILVVDDEYGIRESFKMVLKDSYDVLLVENAHQAIELFTKNSVDVVLLDILLPDGDGLHLLEKIKGLDPNVEILMVTAVKEVQTAVRAIKLGAYEYIIKPFVVEDVLNIIERALEKHRLVKEVTYLRNELERCHPFHEIIFDDGGMRAVMDLISTIADSDGSVLVQGESGTGKELVARAIHNLCSRKTQPFVVINCAAIPSTLMESELFGHHRGAFTGATRTTMGKLEIGNRGTVFLDDIDNLDISTQAKLLRVIQEKEFERLGGTKIIRIDTRFIAASNRDIGDLISRGEFREDLFYRLNVFPIRLPPLRERKKDIPLLLNHFLDVCARRTGKTKKTFSEKALRVLMEYDWPGNVRELQNLVERSFTITKGSEIHLRDISIPHVNGRRNENMTLREAVSAFEKEYIARVLEQVGGNRKKAAEVLGVHRNTLLAKTQDHGIKH
ncbi:MAG: sigma-54-dependent Fis family transcriptional regulator [Deltaproteobacteria bacterium]|nr:sigma-54-dependent Fis family transcriptional regulator [Deltaproteobacteria bacterium]